MDLDGEWGVKEQGGDMVGHPVHWIYYVRANLFQQKKKKVEEKASKEGKRLSKSVSSTLAWPLYELLPLGSCLV